MQSIMRNAGLHKNYLNGTPETYVGRVKSAGTIDFDGLADAMVKQGSTVTKADIIALFENMKMAVESLLIQGFRIDLGGLVEFHTSVKGVFATPGYALARRVNDCMENTAPSLEGAFYDRTFPVWKCA